jgi:hypothetical protein
MNIFKVFTEYGYEFTTLFLVKGMLYISQRN